MPVRRKVVIPLVVWGDAYIRTFLTLALPSFLAPGNIPGCAEVADIHVNILTTRQGALAIESAPVLEQLRRLARVEVKAVIAEAALIEPNKYSIMASCHHAEIRSYQGEDVIVCILSPDCILSNNALTNAYSYIRAGSQAVLVAGPRAALEDASRDLGRWKSADGTMLDIPPRDLVGVLRRNLHPISDSVFFNAVRFTTMPSCLYWSAGTESFIARYFHFHPLLVRVPADRSLPEKHSGTVDATLIEEAGLSDRDCYICTDSDDIAIIELTSRRSMHVPVKLRFRKSAFIERWVAQWALSRHIRMFIDWPIRFKGNDTADFKRAEEIAKANISRLLTRLEARLGR